MTPGGWINMILSVGFVTVLFAWCLHRVHQAMRADQARSAEHLARVEPVEEDEVDDR